MTRTPYNKCNILEIGHWEKERYTQRITNRCWKLLLLNNDDNVIFKGHIRQLQVKRLGFGVVDVSKVEKENHVERNS